MLDVHTQPNFVPKIKNMVNNHLLSEDVPLVGFAFGLPAYKPTRSGQNDNGSLCHALESSNKHQPFFKLESERMDWFRDSHEKNEYSDSVPSLLFIL